MLDEKKAAKRGALGRILRYMKGQIPVVVLAIACAAGSVLLSLYTTVLIGRAIDCIGVKTDFERMMPILIKIAVIIPIVALLQWLMYFSTNLVTHKTVKALRTDIFGHLQSLPLSYIDTQGSSCSWCPSTGR